MNQRVRTGAAWLFVPVVVAVGCGSPQGSRTVQGRGSDGSAPGSGAPKRINAAIRGDPHTLGEAINSAGGGRVAGVREIELLLNVGLGVVDDRGHIRGVLAEDALQTWNAHEWDVR